MNREEIIEKYGCMDVKGLSIPVESLDDILQDITQLSEEEISRIIVNNDTISGAAAEIFSSLNTKKKE